MLVTLQEIIGMAEKGNYCIPAFNVYTTETVMGVFDAAEEAKAPVIMHVYPRLFNEYVGYYLAPAILAAAKKATNQIPNPAGPKYPKISGERSTTEYHNNLIYTAKVAEDRKKI